MQRCGTEMRLHARGKGEGTTHAIPGSKMQPSWTLRFLGISKILSIASGIPKSSRSHSSDTELLTLYTSPHCRHT